jgi:hypothetical protein
MVVAQNQLVVAMSGIVVFSWPHSLGLNNLLHLSGNLSETSQQQSFLLSELVLGKVTEVKSIDTKLCTTFKAK